MCKACVPAPEMIRASWKPHSRRRRTHVAAPKIPKSPRIFPGRSWRALSNLVISNGHVPLLLVFELSRHVSYGVAMTTTVTMVQGGTLEYLAPELCVGEPWVQGVPNAGPPQTRYKVNVFPVRKIGAVPGGLEAGTPRTQGSA